MNDLFEDQVRGRIEKIKALYAEYFMMLDQLLDEDPLPADPESPPAGSSSSISALQKAVDDGARDLRENLESNPGWRESCSEELRSDVDDYAAALTAAGVPHEFHRYDGAGHGFQDYTNPERFRREQSDDAWAKVLDFLAANLAAPS